MTRSVRYNSVRFNWSSIHLKCHEIWKLKALRGWALPSLKRIGIPAGRLLDAKDRHYRVIWPNALRHGMGAIITLINTNIPDSTFKMLETQLEIGVCCLRPWLIVVLSTSTNWMTQVICFCKLFVSFICPLYFIFECFNSLLQKLSKFMFTFFHKMYSSL